MLLGAGGGQAVALTEATDPANPATLVGLGDSVTAGSHCHCAGYIADLAGILSARDGVTVHDHNLGQPGQTSGGLLAALTAGGSGVAPVAQAGLVIITIGANDFAAEMPAMRSGTCGAELACTTRTVHTMKRNVGSIIDRIRSLRAGRHVTIEVTGYWNVFEDGQVARADYPRRLRSASDLLTRHVNTALKAVCADKRARYVDLYTPFKGSDGDVDDTGLLASDGDHPNAAGHQAIARRLAAAS